MKRILNDGRNTAAMIRPAVFLLVLVAITGCSGIKTYPNTMDKNLFVDLKKDRGVRVSLDVYDVDANCRAGYRGTVQLDAKVSEVGIPTGKWLFLSFNFARSSIIFGNSSMGHGTMIKARRGKIYRAKAIYRDDMYNVEIREADSRDAEGREMEHIELSECKPGER